MADATSRRRLNDAIASLQRVTTSRQLDVIHAARSGVPLTLAAVGVLRRVIDHGPLRLSDLAQAARMQPAALSRQVRVLEDGGYIERKTDARDGRVSVVRATAKGRFAHRRVRAVNDELMAEQLYEWSTAELTQLAELIERLVADLRAGDGRAAARE